MKRDIILGFASCALGLLPLLGPVKAQQAGPAGCQQIASNFATNGAIVPLILNPGQERIILCGYALSFNGNATSNAVLISGFGSACATQGNLTTTNESVIIQQTQAVAHDGMAAVLPPGASLCLSSGTGTNFFAGEVNYSLQ